jgi:hypothetical protein
MAFGKTHHCPGVRGADERQAGLSWSQSIDTRRAILTLERRGNVMLCCLEVLLAASVSTKS